MNHKAIQMHRRTFLRGLGSLVALPILDSMLPTRALAALDGSTAANGLPKRLAWVYIPNGANMPDWTPAATGAGYDLPLILQPLKAHRDDMLVVSGLANDKANEYGDGGGAHARASSTILTGVHPRKTAGADICAGVSVDQIAASRIGGQTRLPSLELSCDSGQRTGSCDTGYSCAYQFNISWRSETQPMTPEVDPRQAFERLFGNGDPAASLQARARRALYKKSVLDFVLDDAHRLDRELGITDRRKLDEYLTAVREIELRIEKSEKHPAVIPAGVHEPDMFENYQEQVGLMFDILTLAFQTDTTRISTFIMAHDGSNRPYPFIGINEGHHDLSHHRNDPLKKAKLAQINHFHTTQFARFLDRLKSIKEGEGTLLDNSMIVYVGGLSDGNAHSCENIPLLLAGRGGGMAKSGQHLRVPEKTPVTNLYRSMLDYAGAPTEKVGDSTGELDAVFRRRA